MVAVIVGVFLRTDSGYTLRPPIQSSPIMQRQTALKKKADETNTLKLHLKERIIKSLKDFEIEKDDIRIDDEGFYITLTVKWLIKASVTYKVAINPELLKNKLSVPIKVPGKTLAASSIIIYDKEYKKHGLMTLLFAYLMVYYDVENIALVLPSPDEGKPFFYHLQSLGLIGDISNIWFNAAVYAKANKDNALKFLGIEKQFISKEKVENKGVRIKLEEKLLEGRSVLTSLFEETLAPLKDSAITIAKIKGLFSPAQEKAIFELIGKIRKLKEMKALVDGNLETYVSFLASDDDISFDFGLEDDIARCLLDALKAINLDGTIEYTKNEAHPFVKVEGLDKDIIAIDVLSGKFMQKNKGRAAVSLLEDYVLEIEEAVNHWFSQDNKRLSPYLATKEVMEPIFQQIRKYKIPKIIESLKTNSFNL